MGAARRSGNDGEGGNVRQRRPVGEEATSGAADRSTKAGTHGGDGDVGRRWGEEVTSTGAGVGVAAAGGEGGSGTGEMGGLE